MSLSLQESCQSYERHARRQKRMLSFADYNKTYFTCLPAEQQVEEKFKRTVSQAGKAHGYPIRTRLMSLYHNLTTSNADVTSKVTAVVPSASNSFVHAQPKYSKAVRMNIRAPPTPEVETTLSETTETKETDKEWTLAEYVDAVRASDLKEANGLMVHFVPTHGSPKSLHSLASKLTKVTWEAIRGKEGHTIKMKDGSQMDLSEYELNAEDVKQFVRNRKKKVEGPYFVRFSCI